MMPAPANIREAEQKVMQSMEQVRLGLGRMRVAGRAALTPRPSTLVIVTGVSGLLFFWLARRPRVQSTSAINNLGETAATSSFGLALAFIIRYGMRRFEKSLR
ncbi:MAG: hypothetical protein Q8L65_09340 [Burkholderiales bacterium]|nr:hypothetical protein [Burkholderiales bacterium]